MLKSKIAMALAAAMVMAALYGCSSSDSGLKSDLKEAEDNVTMLEGTLGELEGTLGAIAMALGLDPDADEATILREVNAAPPDQLVLIRAALPELAPDADSAAIVAAIQALQDTLMAADLETEYLHEQAVVAGINFMETTDNMRPGTDVIDTAGQITVDYLLEASVMDLEAAGSAPDAGMSVQAMLSATDAEGMTTDKAFVYSNRMAPGAAEWNDYYDMAAKGVDGGTNDAPGMMAVASTQGLDDEGANTNTEEEIVNYRVTFSTTAAEVAADGHLFDAAALPSGDRQTFNYSDDPDGMSDTDDDNRKFMGSYHGVMGEYECETTPCSATSDEDGNLAALSGTWMFTPASGDSMVMGVAEDSTYVYFGYWLRQTVDEDGGETIGVNHFSGGNGAIEVTAMDEFDCEGLASGTCTASYTGKAGGKYVVKTVTPQNEVATLHTGQFVANVTLDAMFGGETVPSLLWDRIEGTIAGFNDEADDMDRINHWEVDLGVASTTDTTDNLNVGMTNDGMMGGTWTHTFYSRNAVNAATTGVSEEDMPPGDVAGVFDAHWSDGHAIGAYGASRQ